MKSPIEWDRVASRIAADSTFRFLHFFLQVDELNLAEVGRASKLKAGCNVACKVTMSNITAVVLHLFLLHIQELLVVDRQLVNENFGEHAMEE